MTRIISCASGKGGPGKTTIMANLGVALAELGVNVVAVDTNLTTPNLGIHLGVPLYPSTLHDVLKGKLKIEDAMYSHYSGLKVVPAGISLKDIRGVHVGDLPASLLPLVGAHDVVLLDSAAGLGREALASLEAADELLVITTPDLPSVTDAFKAAKLAERMNTRVIGVVINRVSGKKHEITPWYIHRMLDAPILSVIPEDVQVQKALAARTPVVHFDPKSKASRELRKTASYIAGYGYRDYQKSLFGRMFGR